MRSHDNRLVLEVLGDYETLTDFIEAYPQLDDVLASMCAAKTAGDTAKRPLSKSRIFDLLASCDFISSQATQEAWNFAQLSTASIKRYTLAAMTASQFISRELLRECAGVGAVSTDWAPPNLANPIRKHHEDLVGAPSAVLPEGIDGQEHSKTTTIKFGNTSCWGNQLSPPMHLPRCPGDVDSHKGGSAMTETEAAQQQYLEVDLNIVAALGRPRACAIDQP